MGRYYFNIRREGILIADEEGMEFDDLAAAKDEAFTSAREIAIEALKEGRRIDGDQIEVADSDGKSAFTVPVRTAAD